MPRSRGAHIYGEVKGYAATTDLFDFVHPLLGPAGTVGVVVHAGCTGRGWRHTSQDIIG